VDESGLVGAREGDLAELFEAAGLKDVAGAVLPVSRPYGGFDDWWDPFTAGVGPSGAFVAGLQRPDRDALRDRCRSMLPDGAFVLRASAWAARGVVRD
jgi:hypothetical protein